MSSLSFRHVLSFLFLVVLLVVSVQSSSAYPQLHSSSASPFLPPSSLPSISRQPPFQPPPVYGSPAGNIPPQRPPIPMIPALHGPPSNALPVNTTAAKAAAPPPSPVSSRCVDPSSPQWKPFPCPPVTHSPSQNTPLPTIIQDNPYIIIYFRCFAPNDPSFCQKARNAFAFVADHISQTVYFVNPIKVDVTLTPFCADPLQPSCSALSRQVGSAAPALLIPLRDWDGRTRFYPQALARQYNHPIHPQFAPADIIARFATDAPTWFPEDNTPIQSNQIDFRWVALHEMMHGLGFGISAWRDWARPADPALAQRMTPYPVADMSQDISHGFQFNGQFYETVYDSGLVDATHLSTHPTSPPSSATNAYLSPGLANPFFLPRLSDTVSYSLDYFLGPRSVNFASIQEFDRALQSTRAGQIAHALVQKTKTSPALAFDPQDGQLPILLSTGPSILNINPTAIIGHVDEDFYVKSEEFLMCPVIVAGITLEDQLTHVLQFIHRPQDAHIHSPYIGPGLRRILCYMGYSLHSPYSNSSFNPGNLNENNAGNQRVRAQSVVENTSSTGAYSTAPSAQRYRMVDLNMHDPIPGEYT